MSDIAIKVENLSKLYKLGAQKSGSFRESFTNLFKSQTSKNESLNTSDEFWALNDVSFEIKKGEAVGIIGRNGAGKSTLLKVLSRITEPTKGRIQINGRVASLLEVGTGFHPELTGRENIYLNGTILGMSRTEVRAKFDEIVDFSGVEKFIDTPVKHYSSGMYVRLAFAVAAHLEPEILIIDEVLAVGDAEFQKKCLGKMEDVTGQGRTVLFVSHNMGAVQNLCNKGIYLTQGKKVDDGVIDKLIVKYLNDNLDKKAYTRDKSEIGKNLYFESACVKNSGGIQKNEFQLDEDITIISKVKNININQNFQFCLGVLDKYGERIFSVIKNISNSDLKEHSEFLIKTTIPSNILVPGVYSFSLETYIPPGTMVFDRITNVCSIQIHDSGTPFSIFQEGTYGQVFINCPSEVLLAES